MPNCQNRLRRGLTFITGLVECLCFAGIIFGWASLVFILKKDGYFNYLCVNATGINGSQFLDCSGQDEQFSLVFTIASFMNNFITVASGFIFDHFGTTVARLLGIGFHTMGTLMVAFSNSALSVLLFPALSFIAVGGIMLLLTNMQVGNLFGTHRSTIITLYNGAFDSSSALFLIIKLVYESGISLFACFLFLSVCSIIHVLRTLFLFPKTFIPYPLPDGYTYGLSCSKLNAAKQSMIVSSQKNAETEQFASEAPAKQDKTLRECVLSRLFIWHVVWLSVIQLRHYLFIGTLNPTLVKLTDGEPSLVSQYINAFAITQLCGVICAPWNGLIMDRNKRKARAEGMSEQESDLNSSVLSLFLTSLMALVFSICAATPFLQLQYFTFIIQVLNRSFLYGGNAAFLSVAFPSCHFGKLYGLIMCISAVFSLLQYACFALVKSVLDGDPLYVNIALTLVILLAFVHPLSVFLHCRGLASQRAVARL
ncbi:equilibrative nucleobase transporter 1-like [Corythoichthys intestinalis]|uniref:equilibrative nucleobase transporter 1-like n=1 Tax=Corythoichthys intestinalis TaxID=161448 RepID=UPI0025A6000C|nr:equilibrative nucleobase transporter 1-like [Corythoichthys intestinalis]XP_057707144.1 equilibrative nucleobase transporter 1-like [Corythoichthys intestinalis]XP_061793021.1 equilibrative nucleobase transporter 1-like [Nerophis lumbriciformis]